MAHVIETQSTFQEHIPNIPLPDGSFEEILIQCAAGMITCNAFVILQMAQRMHSATYIREAQTAYQIMECVWPDDTEVRDLYDLLYGELC